MPFGINSASEVFQRSMEQLFAGYPCSVIVDDIIGGQDMAEHDANLKTVLDRVREVNLKLNPAKCKFCLDQVCDVGHIFTSNDLKADPSNSSDQRQASPHGCHCCTRFSRDGKLPQ